MAVTVVRDNANFGTANPLTVSYGTAPAEGNLMVLLFWTRASTITTPTGYTLITEVGAGTDHFASYRKVAGASEGSSISVTLSATDQHTYAYYELSGFDTSSPVSGSATTDTTGLTTSRSSGTTASGPDVDDLAIAGFGSRENISAQSFTNSFTLDKNVATGGGTVAELTTAKKTLSASGTVETTMSWTTSSSTRGMVVVIRAAASGAVMKVWNGSSWVVGVPKVWNGSSWVAGVGKVWSGSAWV